MICIVSHGQVGLVILGSSPVLVWPVHLSREDSHLVASGTLTSGCSSSIFSNVPHRAVPKWEGKSIAVSDLVTQ